MAGALNKDQCGALLEVQRLDMVLDELALQSSSLPHKAKVAQIAQKAAEGTGMVAKLEAGIEAFDAQIAELGSAIETLKTKIAKDQSKLDAGAIDYRQIDALSAEIAAHSERIEASETKQLALMEAKEEARKRIADVNQKVSDLLEAKEMTMDTYRHQMAALAAKGHQVTGVRDEKRGDIPHDILSQYDTLRKQKGGSVVGLFDGTRCSACSLKLPTAIADSFTEVGDAGTCSECRRILIYTGDASGDVNE